MQVGVHHKSKKHWFWVYEVTAIFSKNDVIIAMTSRDVQISYIYVFFDAESYNAKIKLVTSENVLRRHLS